MIIYCPVKENLGQGKQATLVYMRLQKKGIKCKLITDYKLLSGKYISNLLLRYFYKIYRLRKTLSSCKECNPILAFGEHAFIVAWLSSFQKNYIVYYACRDDRSMRIKYDKSIRTIILEMVVRLLLLSTRSIVVCQSEEIYKNYGSLYKKYKYPIANYVDTVSNNTILQLPIRETKKITLGMIGRFSLQKNQESILEFLYINSSRYEIKIYGSLIPETPRKLLDSICANPEWYILNKKVRKEDFDQMDVLIIPSLWEGIPNVLLEAFAYGLPIIVSKNIKVESILKGFERFAQSSAMATNLIQFYDPKFTNQLECAIEKIIAANSANSSKKRLPYYGTTFDSEAYNKSIDHLWKGLLCKPLC